MGHIAMKSRKPQYRTLVKALTRMSNAVHNEFDGPSTYAVRRELRRSMEEADRLIVRAEEAMAEKARKKDGDRNAVEGERTAALP